LRYETHLNEVLRKDLEKCLDARDKIYSEQAEFIALRHSIAAIRNAELSDREPLKTRVDLGCNFYCEAEVADPKTIMMSIGMGFYVQMSLDEALAYISKRDAALTEEAELLTKQTTSIKANIKLVIAGLRELQSISVQESRPPLRDIFA